MEHTGISKVWPEWSVVEQIGAGMYGVVYKAVRREHGIESFSAIKVISVPQSRSELNALHSEGLSLDETKSYFEGVVNDFINEIRVMGTLKGHSNIVSVEDYKVLEHSDSIGWDIYIRMELLTPFDQYILGREFTQQEAADLGSAICKALAVCHQKGIIHRDVKPENIFVNEYGAFKLGDFGVARKLENISVSMSQKGTYHYMAPEVAGGTHYDARVDLYSLGIVLYRLLNENHHPFLDSEEQIKDPFARKQALERRLRGEALPAPKNASPEMARVILRACAANPQQRYESAETLDKALQAAAGGESAEPEDPWNETVAVQRPPVSPDQTTQVRPSQRGPKTASGTVPAFGAGERSATPKIALTGLLIALAIIVVIAGQKDSTSRYQYYIDDCSWTEAFAKSKAAGGYLVRIDDKQEYEKILAEINVKGMTGIEFRIGARRDPDKKEYYWVDENNKTFGEKINANSYWAHSEWATGEPSFQWDANSEEFVLICFDSDENRWTWDDVADEVYRPGQGKYGYIVEFDSLEGGGLSI